MSSTRRLVSVSALAALLILTVTVASNADWPSAVGGGTASNGAKFAFSALMGPSSARGDYGSSGQARLDLPDGTKWQGPVRCVAVNAAALNGADAAFVFQYGTDPATGFPYSKRVYVKSGGDYPGGDLIGWDDSTVCNQQTDLTLRPAATGPAANTMAVVKGNIVVSTD
jgi:hypothetical protein